jgi:uncharacterized protein (TIGR02678 family)
MTPPATQQRAGTPTPREQRIAEERRHAARALLHHPLIGREDPAFALILRHEAVLKDRFDEYLGYGLRVRSSHARLIREPLGVDGSRPARVPPHLKARPAEDRWAAFNARRYTMLALTLAVIEGFVERGASQTVLSELADSVRGVAVEEGIPLAFEERADRSAFADVLDYLVHWGVLHNEHPADDHQGWRSADWQDAEALYDIDRGRLSDLPGTAAGIVGANEPADLLHENYPPTEEGRIRRVRHRLFRRLVETPVVYLEDLDDDEAAHFRGAHRQNMESRVSEFFGLQVERRGEGTACIDPQRTLTDLRFPAPGKDRQLALFLCELLEERHVDRRPWVPYAAQRRFALEKAREFSAYWGAGLADDVAAVETLLHDAVLCLTRLRLAELDPDRALRALPACARFAAVTVNQKGLPLA